MRASIFFRLGILPSGLACRRSARPLRARDGDAPHKGRGSTVFRTGKWKLAHENRHRWQVLTVWGRRFAFAILRLKSALHRACSGARGESGPKTADLQRTSNDLKPSEPASEAGFSCAARWFCRLDAAWAVAVPFSARAVVRPVWLDPVFGLRAPGSLRDDSPVRGSRNPGGPCGYSPVFGSRNPGGPWGSSPLANVRLGPAEGSRFSGKG